jgi:hypothetical protein
MAFLPTFIALVLTAAVALASGGLFLALLAGLNRLEVAAVGPTARLGSGRVSGCGPRLPGLDTR